MNSNDKTDITPEEVEKLIKRNKSEKYQGYAHDGYHHQNGLVPESKAIYDKLMHKRKMKLLKWKAKSNILSNKQIINVPVVLQLEVIDGVAVVPQIIMDSIIMHTKRLLTYSLEELEKHYNIMLVSENEITSGKPTKK